MSVIFSTTLHSTRKRYGPNITFGNFSLTFFYTETSSTFFSTFSHFGCLGVNWKTIGGREGFFSTSSSVVSVREFLLFSFLPYPVIGASGAIYGILLAFGWLFPNRPIYIYFLFPIPAKYMVIIFGLIEFFSSGSGGGGVAHLTHLGGLVFGLFFMAYPVIRQKLRREYYKRKWSQRGPNGKNYYH